jgi:hypothetical protein
MHTLALVAYWGAVHPSSKQQEAIKLPANGHAAAVRAAAPTTDRAMSAQGCDASTQIKNLQIWIRIKR